MRAVFDEKNKVFLLHTQNTTYAIAVTEDKIGRASCRERV